MHKPTIVHHAANRPRLRDTIRVAIKAANPIAWYAAIVSLPLFIAAGLTLFAALTR